MRLVVRRKVIVVPYVRTPTDTRFMVVKDRKHKEWTFITGGVKSKETDMQAAERELREETKGTLGLDFTMLPCKMFQFKTDYRESQEIIDDREKRQVVHTVYTVYMIDISPLDTNTIKTQFRSIKRMKGAYNENADLSFETLDSFARKTHVWKFIREHVLPSTHFNEIAQMQPKWA